MSISRLALVALLVGCANATESGIEVDAEGIAPQVDGGAPVDESDAAGAGADATAADAAPDPDDLADAALPDSALPDAAPPDVVLFDAAIDASGEDAACTPEWVSLLENGGFELGATNWTQYSLGGWDVILSADSLPVVPHSGSYAVWLGGYYDAVDWVFQDVVIPADALDLRLSGYQFIATAETSGEWDFLMLGIYDTTGSLVESLATLSNVDSTTDWEPFVFLAPHSHAGETIRLGFVGVTDDLYNTNFFLDTATLEVLVCR